MSETGQKTIALSNPRLMQWRMLKDRIARHAMAFGGISVIIAILLIFFYLLVVVFPLFVPANIEQVADYEVPGNQATETLHLALEEQNEIGVRYTSDAEIIFFDVVSGDVKSIHQMPHGSDTDVSAFAFADLATDLVAFGYEDGFMDIVKPEYKLSYPDDQRVITPVLTYPLSEDTLQIFAEGEAIDELAIQSTEDEATIAAYNNDAGLLRIVHFLKEVSFLTDEVELERSDTDIHFDDPVDWLLLDKQQRNLYLVSRNGALTFYDISDKDMPEKVQTVQLVGKGRKVQSVRFLTGHISLLVADDQGQISQWFPVRESGTTFYLTHIRDFDAAEARVTDMTVETRRKGFLSASEDGSIGIFHSTANRTVLEEQITDKTIVRIAVSPRATRLLSLDEEQHLYVTDIENEHPEVSWSSLWGKVWYESYEEPQYIWQSSSASNDFEPKFSLTPLSFGTLKAAFYAMLFAMPLAIMGAVFTAYFMAPKMRQIVKPTIEIMEALPTVILGFLAGLWLAPFIESNLPGIFSLLIIMPVGILLFSFAWFMLPLDVRNRIPDGWQAAILVPVIIAIGWLSLSLSVPMEYAFFDGDMPSWLSNEMGIGFDQRNSIVVGVAMGFAVIPTIFSITEDAIFGVPKHLTFGSLALGATPWQTLVRVVLLTASPGIFSAVMIGMGRAVGETMIVLMATGNTPVMDFSMFQGMRTLSANIAVEMPESEVASTHYRVLFLAALVLFVFTFMFNTLAEIVRQRLRVKYSSI